MNSVLKDPQGMEIQKSYNLAQILKHNLKYLYLILPFWILQSLKMVTLLDR